MATYTQNLFAFCKKKKCETEFRVFSVLCNKTFVARVHVQVAHAYM